jgi:predicted RecB family endonuclease
VIQGNGAIDILAERPGEHVAIEVETGRSDIRENMRKISAAGFDRVVFMATSPSAATACQRAVEDLEPEQKGRIELLTWLDIS